MKMPVRLAPRTLAEVIFWILIAILGGLIITACDSEFASNQFPMELNRAARPVVIVSCNKRGVILRDANGKVYAYDGTVYFARILAQSKAKEGDVFLP